MNARTRQQNEAEGRKAEKHVARYLKRRGSNNAKICRQKMIS